MPVIPADRDGRVRIGIISLREHTVCGRPHGEAEKSGVKPVCWCVSQMAYVSDACRTRLCDECRTLAKLPKNGGISRRGLSAICLTLASGRSLLRGIDPPDRSHADIARL